MAIHRFLYAFRSVRALRALLGLFLGAVGRLLGALFPGTAGNLSSGSKMDLPEQEQLDPSRPSAPVSFPIKDLQSLASRSYFASFHYPFNRASVPLPPDAATGLPPRRRLLVCHDMAGGYQDDRWVQGGSNPDAYAIWHWHLIDVFVYFSHSLVTLPPPCWTNAAHAHGVRVLGTFLTEWDEGRAICRTLLSSKDFARMYAERLVEIATALGFDGWLVNIENELDLQQIPILKEFLSHLTEKMHASVPGSLVIWYDGVTIDGQLIWQNVMNKNNKPFFDLCDGIFINYTWKASYPELSAAVAGDRKFDVYMGIDVFGRNTYGGGQWKANVALDLLKKVDISAAIFAPGWVYETKQPPDFQTAQNRWWGLVENSWGILKRYPKALPFYSNFDQGHGYHFSVEGVKVADVPWNNISCQSIQPILDISMNSVQTPIEVQLNFKNESYSGGGSITFSGSLNDNAIFKARLFLLELPLGNLPVHISYSVSSEENSVLALLFRLSSDDNRERMSILLAAGGLSFLPANLLNEFDQITATLVIEGKHTTGPGWILHEGSIEMPGHTLTEICAVCYMKSEQDSNQSAQDNGQHLKKCSTAVVSSSTFYASLGHISIETSQNDFPDAVSWMVSCENVSWTTVSDGTKTVSTKITWTLKTGSTSSLMWYNIFVEKVAKKDDDSSITVTYAEDFLGLTRLGCYYVSDLKVPAGIAALKFIIQVCRLDGACQKLDASPRFELAVEG